ncbi:hypothetical protein B0H14DRAFT_3175264 [Mycena olivaceomarginata]|nr:hypothetical protein B0H14DRAFT_3175264 [Mycena olivaceomarginata]
MDGHILGTKQWPPNRTHSRSTSLTSIPSPLRIIHGPEPTDTPTPSPPATPVRKLFKNGYEVTPKGLYSPSYALNSPGARNQVPLERADAIPLAPQKALDPYEWTDIAVQNNLIPLGGRLHSFQVTAANLVLMQRGDVETCQSNGFSDIEQQAEYTESTKHEASAPTFLRHRKNLTCGYGKEVVLEQLVLTLNEFYLDRISVFLSDKSQLSGPDSITKIVQMGKETQGDDNESQEKETLHRHRLHLSNKELSNDLLPLINPKIIFLPEPHTMRASSPSSDSDIPDLESVYSSESDCESEESDYVSAPQDAATTLAKPATKSNKPPLTSTAKLLPGSSAAFPKFYTSSRRHKQTSGSIQQWIHIDMSGQIACNLENA